MDTSNNILSLINNAPDKILTSVAQRVKERRLEAEQTQKELAQRAGIPLIFYLQRVSMVTTPPLSTGRANLH